MTLSYLLPALLLLIPLGIWLTTTIVVTQQQHVRIIETFGRFAGVRSSGLSFKAPWPIQTARPDFSLKIREITEDVTVKSSDNAFLTVPIRVQFSVDPDRAQEAFYKLDKPEQQIRSYIVNTVRATASGTSFVDLFGSRTTIEDGVEGTVKGRMGNFGYKIVNVLVDDPMPSEQLRETFDRVIASQRLREAAINEGEAARTLAVAKATAEGEALKIKAQAYAEFRKTVADGNADALERFVGKTGLTASDGLAFFTSINEMEALRDAAGAGATVVFNATSRDADRGALMGLLAQGRGEAAERAGGGAARPDLALARGA